MNYPCSSSLLPPRPDERRNRRSSRGWLWSAVLNASGILLCFLLLACRAGENDTMQPAAALPPRSISLQELNQFFGVSLEGPWEMYWGRYVSQEELVSPHAPLPDAILAHLHGWSGMKIRGKRLGSFGRATYRMRLALPDSDLPLGLRLVHQTSCARLFNNGQLVAEQGFSAPDDRSCHPDRQDLAGFFQNESRDRKSVV